MRRLLLSACMWTAVCAAAEPVSVRSAALSEVATAAGQEIAAVVVAGNDSTLSAELSAVVAAVHVDVGSRVRRGEVLLRLDDRDATLQRSQARAQRQAAAARARLAAQRRQRGEELAPQGHIAADELLALRAADEAATADLAVADAALALAARQLEKTVLRAPFDGEVLARHAQVGAMASPGQPLLRLVDDAGREVEARVPEELAAALAEAGTLQLSASGRDWPVAIARFGSAVDPASRARTLRLRFTAEAAPTGSSGQLRWTSPGFRIPAELLVERGGRLGVFIVDNGVARFHALPGALPGRGAALDLPADSRIVTAGQQSLQDGTSVAPDGTP